MRIASDFRDYYDGMAAHDREPDPRYLRFTRILNLVAHGAEPVSPGADEAIRHLADVELLRRDAPRPPVGQVHVVAFCGRAYVFYEVAAGARDRIYAHTFARYRAALDEAEVSRRVLDPIDEDGRAWSALPLSRVISTAPFIHFNAPCFVLAQSGRVVVNPQLRQIDFAAVMQPHQAWQELSMFLGNALVGAGVEPRPITDEMKAHAHGFDKKSFRRAKGGRKVSDRGEW